MRKENEGKKWEEWDRHHLYSTLCKEPSPQANPELRTYENQNNSKYYCGDTTYAQKANWKQFEGL